MIFIKSLIIISFLFLSSSVYSDNKNNTTDDVKDLNKQIEQVWEKNVTPLTKVVGKQWASLLTSTQVESDKLGNAVKETWNNALNGSDAGKEIKQAGSALSHFILQEVDDTKQTATASKRLVDEGELLNGIWYLSVNLIKETDDNLAEAVQESELINILGKITATTYGGPQGAAAYASWYAYKKTKDPEVALKVGIMSGANNAGFSAVNEPSSITQLLKDNIITGVMAGLNAAISGGNDKRVKDVFLKNAKIGLAHDLPVINSKKNISEQNKKEESKIKQSSQITNF